MVSNFALNNVYNADKSAICIGVHLEAQLTLLPKRQKMKKDGYTVLLGTNCDGNDKLTPLVVGRSRKSRCFGEATPAELGFHCDVGPKAWMIQSIGFLSWIYTLAVLEDEKYKYYFTIHPYTETKPLYHRFVMYRFVFPEKNSITATTA